MCLYLVHRVFYENNLLHEGYRGAYSPSNSEKGYFSSFISTII